MIGRLIPLACRRLAVATFAAALGAAAAPGVGQAADISYPPSRSLNDIAAWLQRDTPIALGQVVDVSPSAVTAVTAAAPTGQPRGFLANISSEAVDPEILAQEGIASWSIPVEIDCDRRAVRLGVMTGFRGRDLTSDPRTVRDADTQWVNPMANAPLGATVRALCDREFRRPFAGRVKVAANAQPPSPSPGPTQPPATAKAPTLRPTLAPARPAAAPVSAAEKSSPPTRAAKAKSASGGGSVTVQIGASPSLPDTQTLLAKFKKKFAPELSGLNAAVATVQVEGKTVNRALISGFASPAEANGFCRKLAQSGQACFIRR